MAVQRQIFFLITLCSCIIIKATDYLAIGESENFVAPCSKEDDRGNTRYEDYLDVSNVVHTYSEDWDTTYCNGDIVVKMALPNAPIKIESDIYRWERGEWVNTVWFLRREDFCASFESAFEFWHSMVMKIPKEQRVCPPKLGSKYTMINTTNHILLKNMPSRDLAGTYKAVSHMKVDNVTICTTILMTINKL